MRECVSFVCEICGSVSLNERDVLNCEAQGKTNKFNIGDIVIIDPDPEIDDRTQSSLVKITDINFKVCSHNPAYVLSMSRFVALIEFAIAVPENQEKYELGGVPQGYISRLATKEEITTAGT